MRRGLKAIQHNLIFTRSMILAFALTMALILCILHGIKAKQRTIRRINGMIYEGQVTGKFWRVARYQEGQVTLTKYERVIELACSLPEDIRVGDKVSFIASLQKGKPSSVSLWRPIEIRFHGTSGFRYWLSLLAVFVVLIMTVNRFRFDGASMSLTPKKGEE
jgi:hypothetical protein